MKRIALSMAFGAIAIGAGLEWWRSCAARA
jgi:hypothetical protein